MNKILLKFGVFDYSCYLCIQILHQEWRNAHQPAYSESLAAVVKKMRVRITNPLKINDYGNQED